ncbi:hypothetical protein M8C21_016228, partial [Ambrosia artemisiifolia]
PHPFIYVPSVLSSLFFLLSSPSLNNRPPLPGKKKTCPRRKVVGSLLLTSGHDLSSVVTCRLHRLHGVDGDGPPYVVCGGGLTVPVRRWYRALIATTKMQKTRFAALINGMILAHSSPAISISAQENRLLAIFSGSGHLRGEELMDCMEFKSFVRSRCDLVKNDDGKE